MKLVQVKDITSYILYTEIKAKNQFTSLINACVSHELRNPLNSIIAKNIEKVALYEKLKNNFQRFGQSVKMSDIFRACQEILEKLTDGVEVQQNSAKMMQFIIQDMLDFAQIKSDKFRHNYQLFNIRESIEKVMSILRQKATDKQIKFTAKFKNIGMDDENYWGDLHSPMINCDENRIMQVLLGLQSNALKFTQKGKVETLIEIFHDYEGEKFLRISVKDSGIGIPLENRDKLFKLFGFIQDHKDMNVNGIGLGLMISKLIVEKFEGNISFTSQEGIGSCFTFTFKLQTALDIKSQDSSGLQHLDQTYLVFQWKPKIENSREILEESTQQNLNSVKFKMFDDTERSLDEGEKRILIVDDQGFNIDAALIILKYCIKLKDSDKICDFASDGLQAFKKVKENIKKNKQ